MTPYRYGQQHSDDHISWRTMFICWVLIFSLIAVASWLYLVENKLKQLSLEARAVTDNIYAHLQRFEAVPSILSEQPNLRPVIYKPSGETQARINRELARLNSELLTDVIYILDAKGTTVASSNYQQDDSFLGKNYDFRPYFMRAIQGESVTYQALGTASGLLGYYYAHPIHGINEILGVVVVKVNLSFVQDLLEKPPHGFIVTDKLGVVLAASDKRHIFHTMWPLTDEEVNAIHHTRQYGDVVLEQLGDSFDESRLCLRQPYHCQRHLYRQREIPANQWSLFAVAPLGLLYQQLFINLALFSVIYWLAISAYFYNRSQKHYREQLSLANDQLEMRLNFLTKDLRETNAELQQSVDHYREAKEALEQTQDELIQTEKMAVLGEVSVGLNHELNQPILAIKAYADNALKFLARNNPDAAAQNLREIDTITESMAMIVARFKVFSRKETQKTQIDVNEAISGALIIFRPTATAQHVTLHTPTGQPFKAFCNLVQLQQVVLNLLVNAAQAMAKQDQKQITIRLGSTEKTTFIEIDDNGPGLGTITEKQLFTPFYTTKPQGLGLGLSLSKRIIESFNGALYTQTSQLGGTCFRIELTRQQEPL